MLTLQEEEEFEEDEGGMNNVICADRPGIFGSVIIDDIPISAGREKGRRAKSERGGINRHWDRSGVGDSNADHWGFFSPVNSPNIDGSAVPLIFTAGVRRKRIVVGEQENCSKNIFGFMVLRILPSYYPLINSEIV
ncbi:hypothetical protein HAX54_029682 [Datura stramonium]|uniref:Uncharacterized protein n=1 Tax=Datura stramonium TaxID=4076 RepID=A0ABS8V6E3_DATST|nr:hypothetical protein [Datura stramonium]